ncbi:hypothetical protein WIW50_10085 [Flavobacteriaceae bacterium 3-367]
MLPISKIKIGRNSFIIFFLITLLTDNCVQSQNDEKSFVKMSKTISKYEYYKLLQTNHDSYVSFLVKDKKSKKIYELTSFSNQKTIFKKRYGDDSEIESYENEESFFQDNEDNVNEKLQHPLFGYRNLMADIANNKNTLIQTFYNDLNLEPTKNILEVNFDKINEKLIQIGLEKAYNEYYLHLILLCGDYLRAVSKNDTKWDLVHNSNYPLSFQPSVVDSCGNNYYFSLNINLARGMMSYFLGEDYAEDSGVDTNIPFDLRKVVNLSLDHKDSLHKNCN